jgi:nucleotide-binding universal stress UspA family protein
MIVEAKMNLEKLLFPTDFSDSNDDAFGYAQSLAAESGALLYIAHIDEVGGLNPEAAQADLLYSSPLGGDDRREVRNRLRSIRPTLDGVIYKHRYFRGSPVEEILRFVQREDIDLIVMSSHGRTGISRLLMGSVAEAVMRKAPCPVLVVKQPVQGSEPASEIPLPLAQN